MSEPHRIIENDDDWVRAEDTLTFVLPGTALVERERIAKARAAGNALPEAHYIAACERAGIPTKKRRRLPGGYDIYLPTWAAPFLEATLARSAQQARVLRRIATDVEYRAAGVAIWRLAGLEALTQWIEQEK
jgi:hypothetical protein